MSKSQGMFNVDATMAALKAVDTGGVLVDWLRDLGLEGDRAWVWLAEQIHERCRSIEPVQRLNRLRMPAAVAQQASNEMAVLAGVVTVLEGIRLVAAAPPSD
jgi:hypothetical protein